MSKKVILITGASSGIGKTTAKKLINEGHIVYGAARRVEKMNDIKGLKTIKLDVSKEEDCKKAVDTVMNREGRIDVLFNNAGFGLYGSVEDIPLKDARYQFDVNMFGFAAMTKAVLPHMRKQNSGKIINTSSMGGKIYTPLGAWYHATKHALEGFSDCLRLELKQFNIDVVVIEPGIIQTSFGDVVGGPMMKYSGKGVYSNLAKRVARTTENSYKEGGGTSPDVIANKVSKAINARKPKTRYVKGKYASMMINTRKWFGDKVFDKMIMSTVK